MAFLELDRSASGQRKPLMVSGACWVLLIGSIVKQGPGFFLIPFGILYVFCFVRNLLCDSSQF